MDCQMLERLNALGISKEQLKTHIAPAVQYGFHGTLKPPFYLSSPLLETMLIEDLKTAAADEPSFFLPALKLACIGRFITLVPLVYHSRYLFKTN